MRRKGKLKTVYSDHFALQVVLGGMPRAFCQQDGNEPSWNLQRPGGWEVYEEMTNHEAIRIQDIVDNTELSIDEVVEKIEKIETKIKFRAFGKTKPSTCKSKKNKIKSCKEGRVGAGKRSDSCQEDGVPGDDETSGRAGGMAHTYQEDGCIQRGAGFKAGASAQLCQEDGGTGHLGEGEGQRAGDTTRPCLKDGGTEDDIAKELLKKQSRAVEEAIDTIKAGKHGRVGNVFKMREMIEGSKRKVQEPNAIKDPNTEEIIVASKRIKAVTLQYCVDTLQNNKPDKEYERLLGLKKELHERRMEERDGDIEVTKEDFEDLKG